MKVVLVSPNTLRKNTAGIEQSVYYLADYLRTHKVDVEVFCTAKKAGGKAEYKGIPLTEFSRVAPGNAYFFSPELYAALRTGMQDIIHCYGSNNMATMLALLAKKPRQKLIITGASSVSSSPIRKYLHAPMYFFYRALAHKIDKLICVSEYERRLFEKEFNLPPERYVQIPNGIDLNAIAGVKAEKVSHTILTVARLVKQKGVHRLVNALPLVLKKYPDAVLHVVGDGIERKKIENQVHELGLDKNVVFHGHIQFEDNRKLLELFARAHVFSLLADSESQGLVYGMGIASKCHVVATHSSAMNELIAAKTAHGIENPDDAEEVARTLIKCFESPAPRVDPEKVVWSWNRVGREVLKVYRSVLN